MLLSRIIQKKFEAVWGRYDGNPACYYFSPKDFPDIRQETMHVQGDHGVTLKGSFYFYGSLRPDRLVVFDHGIGAGHLAYFREIELLAKNGYTVYSYDHTGCVETGGSGIGGFAQGVSDLDHVLGALMRDARFAGQSVRLVGHSWGGYSAMNAAGLHPEVTHVVSLAGFLSARSLIEQYLPKIVFRYLPEIMDTERDRNPAYADLDARESLKKSGAKFLYIQSPDDAMVRYDMAWQPLAEALSGRPDTEFITVEHRGHTPHYTGGAVGLLGRMNGELAALTRHRKLKTPEQQAAFRRAQNWEAITEQDPVIWQKIFVFLNS